MVTTLPSLLTDEPVRPLTAMTGDVEPVTLTADWRHKREDTGR